MVEFSLRPNLHISRSMFAQATDTSCLSVAQDFCGNSSASGIGKALFQGRAGQALPVSGKLMVYLLVQGRVLGHPGEWNHRLPPERARVPFPLLRGHHSPCFEARQPEPLPQKLYIPSHKRTGMPRGRHSPCSLFGSAFQCFPPNVHFNATLFCLRTSIWFLVV